MKAQFKMYLTNFGQKKKKSSWFIGKANIALRKKFFIIKMSKFVFNKKILNILGLLKYYFLYIRRILEIS